MTERFTVMKRVGTSGNYFRVTDQNRNLLRNGKMCEVEVELVDGKMVELNRSTSDIAGSPKIAPIIEEILALDRKRAILIAAVARKNGGEKALQDVGISAPKQTIHDNPATRKKDNDAKNAAKVKSETAKMNAARNEKRNTVSSGEAAKKVKPAEVKHVGLPVTEPQFDEDI